MALGVLGGSPAGLRSPAACTWSTHHRSRQKSSWTATADAQVAGTAGERTRPHVAGTGPFQLALVSLRDSFFALISPGDAVPELRNNCIAVDRARYLVLRVVQDDPCSIETNIQLRSSYCEGRGPRPQEIKKTPNITKPLKTMWLKCRTSPQSLSTVGQISRR